MSFSDVQHSNPELPQIPTYSLQHSLTIDPSSPVCSSDWQPFSEDSGPALLRFCYQMFPCKGCQELKLGICIKAWYTFKLRLFTLVWKPVFTNWILIHKTTNKCSTLKMPVFVKVAILPLNKSSKAKDTSPIHALQFVTRYKKFFKGSENCSSKKHSNKRNDLTIENVVVQLVILKALYLREMITLPNSTKTGISAPCMNLGA